ncbi:MAG: hypothetical protein ACREOE_15170, partial [Gemmatimonadales bacterium]
ALCVAGALYGGHPESVAVVGLAALVFLTVLLWARARAVGDLRRPVTDLVVSSLAGAALAAPLLLPGVQVVDLSTRAASKGSPGVALSHLPDLLVAFHRPDTSVPSPYLGVVTLVLAALALRRARRAPAVLALGATTLVAALLAFNTPISALVQSLPRIGSITWGREAMVLALAVAVLAATGLDRLRPTRARPEDIRFALRARGVAAAALALTGLGIATGVFHAGHDPASAFAWPVAEVLGSAAFLALLAGRWRPVPRVRAAGRATLVTLQGLALVFSGVSFWSISSTYFAATPALTTLSSMTGSSLVARGDCWARPFSNEPGRETGIRPNANIAYGIRELAAYEPVLPRAYYRAWTALGGSHVSKNLRRVGVLCPVITSADLARLLGVSYILTLP